MEILPNQQPYEPDLEKIKTEQKRLLEFQSSDHASKKKTDGMFGAVSLYMVAMEFFVLIVVPLGLFLWLGLKLQAKWGQDWPVLVAIFLALAVSSMSIYKHIVRLKKKLKL